MRRLPLTVFTLFTAIGWLTAPPASAQTLRIGLSTEPMSLDPHYYNLSPNNQIAKHMFESLIATNAKLSLRPSLAEFWRTVDDTSWEFKLRKNVKFHDGSAFDANDVLFTFCRIPTARNSPSPFTIYTKSIASISAPDSHTVISKTRTPYPPLPKDLTVVGIISDSLIGGEKVKFSASRKVLDDSIDQATVTINRNKRRRLLQQASRRAVNKMGVIPVHYEVTPWAVKKRLNYKARADQETYAFDVVSSSKASSSLAGRVGSQ